MSDRELAQPRPLTTLERYLRRSEIQGAALVFVTELDFAGPLDPRRLEHAVRTAIVHHPLLRSIVVAAETIPAWLPTAIDRVFEHRRVDRLPPPFAVPPVPIDLSCMPGLSVRLISASDGQCRITASCHHVCADGQGIARFLRDVCAAYAALCRGDEPQFAIDAHRLDGRGEQCPPGRRAPIGAAEGMRNLWVTIQGRTARFAPLGDCNSAAEATPAEPAGEPAQNLVVEAELDSALASQIRDHLRRRHLVLNDFSLAAAMFMLAHADPPLQPPGYFTILNPVDLRTWADRRSPASNHWGFAFVRRRACDWTDPEELVESIAEQMRYVRERGVATELIKGVALVERIPGGLWMIEKSKRFMATATLTCMSNLAVGRRHGLTAGADGRYLGSARLARISAAAPLPPGVPLAITIIASGKRLSITMRGCPQHFTPLRLQRLLDGWRTGCKWICQS